MTKRRTYGDGGIDARGQNSWRLRYRVNGKRFTKAFRGQSAIVRGGLKQFTLSALTAIRLSTNVHRNLPLSGRQGGVKVEYSTRVVL